MVDYRRKQHRLKELVETSQFWDAEELLRNLDEEMDRLERGLGHMVWDIHGRPVTMCLRPLPVTPKFSLSETDDRLELKVLLPGFEKDSVRLQVDKGGVEVFALKSEEFCRPYYVRVEARSILDPESADASLSEGTLVVKIGKVKKKRLEVRDE